MVKAPRAVRKLRREVSVTLGYYLKRYGSFPFNCSSLGGNGDDFRHRTIALIDSDVGIGMAIGIGVGDGNPPEGLSANHTRTLGVRTIQRLKELIVFVGVTVRPAIDGNRLNVTRRIETSSRQH